MGNLSKVSETLTSLWAANLIFFFKSMLDPIIFYYTYHSDVTTQNLQIILINKKNEHTCIQFIEFSITTK